MGRPDFPRTIMDFQERFATEAACLEYLAASRWSEAAFQTLLGLSTQHAPSTYTQITIHAA